MLDSIWRWKIILYSPFLLQFPSNLYTNKYIYREVGDIRKWGSANASKNIARNLAFCEVMNETAVLELSDHNPVVAVFRL